ncbi:hypothetical protein CcCBS67573_g05262 [Chytriomyces confervae]|uniref:Dolichyl-diphosphooligosaccharide-protein glycosyltransferase subunit OST5 n=1 Tax=Chytriomyces confervae TaxID=246404 RepID=A0A507FD14_9FUNG|nr:hypothetical protein HDU80_002149 [Chytriomyces hyalinus]TPX73467.1 hypothetical protein CcCBS67573_g05262 [Chytriomyces confervae]
MQDWSASNLAPFTSPVDPSLFVTLSFLLVGCGLGAASLLFVYELNVAKNARSIAYEMTLALPSSLFLGFGIVMLFSAIGIHV